MGVDHYNTRNSAPIHIDRVVTNDLSEYNQT